MAPRSEDANIRARTADHEPPLTNHRLTNQGPEAMAGKLTIHYDRVEDILRIEKLPPYPEQGTEQIDEGIVVRLNPNTHEVEGVEIKSYFDRISSGDSIELPLAADLRLSM